MTWATIDLLGVIIEIEYSATQYRPATHWEPAEGSEIEVESYLVGGQNIGELISIRTEDLVLEKLREQLGESEQLAQEDAAEARAEYRNEMMREMSREERISA